MSAVPPSPSGSLEAVSCNLCGSIRSAPCFQEDYQGSVYTVVRCLRCGLRYVNPRPVIPPPAGPPDPEEEDRLARAERAPYFRRWLKRLRALSPGRRLLDVGCGTGVFLDLAVKKYGFQGRGLEPDASAAAYARGRGLSVEEANLESPGAPSASFDLITFWDVLEHLPDPRAALAAASARLREKGIVLIKVPNARALTAAVARLLHRFRGERMIRRGHPLQHLYHFSPATLKALAESAGLQVIEAVTEESAFSAVSPSRLRRGAKAVLRRAFRLLPLGCDEEIVVAARKRSDRPFLTVPVSKGGA